MRNFLFNALLLANSRNISVIPSEPKYEQLTFIAASAGSTVKLIKTESPTVDGLQYRTSTTNAWQQYNIDTVITLANENDIVQFRNTNNALGKYVSSTFHYVQFVMTGSIKAARKCFIINKLCNCGSSSSLIWFI